MKHLGYLLCSLSLSMGVAQAAQLKIETPAFSLMKNNDTKHASIQYLSTTGCKMMSVTHGVAIPFPTTRGYTERVEVKGKDSVELAYEGKTSPCRYRATSAMVFIGTESSRKLTDERLFETVNLYQAEGEEEAINDIKLTCRRFEHVYAYSKTSDTYFECKLATEENYPSGAVAISTDLSKDISISIEIAPESLPLNP